MKTMNVTEVQMQSLNTSFPSNPSQCGETRRRQGRSDDNENYFADEVLGDDDVYDDNDYDYADMMRLAVVTC